MDVLVDLSVVHLWNEVESLILLTRVDSERLSDCIMVVTMVGSLKYVDMKIP